MQVLALCADFLSLIPGGNWVAIFIMWLAGEISGVKVLSLTHSPGVTLLTLGTEFIWPISVIPMWSIRTYFAIKASEGSV
jgi:hypothetical protein